MASWTNPVDVNNGDVLTTSLWNNLLGADGSLQYLYENLPTLGNSAAIRKTTNTAIAASDVTIIFNEVVSYGNISTITPTIGASNSLDGAGYYWFGFYLRQSAASNRIYTITLNIGSGYSIQRELIAPRSTLLTTSAINFLTYVPSGFDTFSVAIRSNSGTATTILASNFPSPSQVLFWKKIKGI